MNLLKQSTWALTHGAQIMAACFHIRFLALFGLSEKQKWVIVCNYFNTMFHINKMVFF